MDVVNRIAECYDPYSARLKSGHRRRKHRAKGVTVHRILVPDSPTDSKTIADLHRTLPELGRKMAYPIVVLESGVVEQALPLDCWGWDARAHSPSHIAVACAGNFTKHDMPGPQAESLLKVLWWLAMWLESTDIYGHTERPKATNWIGHECPGEHVNMPAIREGIRARTQESPECPPNPGFILVS